MVRRRHNYGPDGHDSAPGHNRSPPPERVTDEDTEDCSKETSQIVGSDGNPLIQLALRLLGALKMFLEGVNLGEVFRERR